MSEDLLLLTFVHPTLPSKTLKAEIGSDATPAYVIEELVSAKFMPPAASDARYKLRRDKTGDQLLDDATLGSVGIGTGEQLTIDHTVTGAS